MRLVSAKFEHDMGIRLQDLQREAAERREREERAAKEKARELENMRILCADPPRLLQLVALEAKALLQGQASAFLLDGHAQSRGRY